MLRCKMSSVPSSDADIATISSRPAMRRRKGAELRRRPPLVLSISSLMSLRISARWARTPKPLIANRSLAFRARPHCVTSRASFSAVIAAWISTGSAASLTSSRTFWRHLSWASSSGSAPRRSRLLAGTTGWEGTAFRGQPLQVATNLQAAVKQPIPTLRNLQGRDLQRSTEDRSRVEFHGCHRRAGRPSSSERAASGSASAWAPVNSR